MLCTRVDNAIGMITNYLSHFIMLDHFVKRTSILLILLAGLGGCISSLDEILPEKDSSKTLSCLIDGKPFKAAGDQGLLADDFIITEMVEDENSFLLTVFGVNIEDNGEALAVGFMLAGRNLKDIEQGDTFTEWVPLDDVEGVFEGAMGGVEKRKSPTSNDPIYKAGSNHSGKMSLTVSDIDLVGKKISGTFQFSAKDDENNILLEVTQGSFENIDWE